MSAPARMTLTSYAVLSLIAEQDRSAYEITVMCKVLLGDYMDRSVSALYHEPKRLAGLGLLLLAPESNGRQRRTICTITEEGRGALEKWRSSPAQSPQFESEELVRLVFCHPEDKEAIRKNVASLCNQVLEQTHSSLRQIEGAENRFAQRSQMDAQIKLRVMARFHLEYGLAFLRWSEWARSVSGSGSPDRSESERFWDAGSLEMDLRHARERLSLTGLTDGEAEAQSA